jgi:D-alanyl-D-alanine carboxypeptidase
MKWKKYIAAFMAVFFLSSSVVSAYAADTQEYEIKAPHMYAHAYAVMDANSGKVLFGENVDGKIYPASTAKLMSAIVAVESGTPLDTVIETKSKIVNHTTLGTYNLGMNGGESYTLSNLLHMSLMASAADATDTMAVGIYGSRSAFAEKMNEKAAELGLTHTSFDNPVGSDIGGGFNKTYTTATEMSEIARYAMTLEPIRKITAKTYYKIKGKGSQNGRRISNTNWFYTQYPYNSDYFTIIGSKTGTTNAAGYVFIATAVDDEGHELICSYFGKESKASTFKWINYLLTYAFKQYKKGNLTLTKGAYNVRYHEDADIYTRCIDADVLTTNENGTFDFDQLITEEQAAKILCEGLAPDVENSSSHGYFAAISSGSDANCKKEYLVDALTQALPGIKNVAPVKTAIDNLSNTDDLTAEDACHLAGVVSDNLMLYEMSFPTYEMRTWNEENLVPFMAVENLEFLDLAE